MEHLQSALLRSAVEVDKEVAASDEVKAREGRVFNQVVVGEEHPLPEFASDAEALVLLREELAEALG